MSEEEAPGLLKELIKRGFRTFVDSVDNRGSVTRRSSRKWIAWAQVVVEPRVRSLPVVRAHPESNYGRMSKFSSAIVSHSPLSLHLFHHLPFLSLAAAPPLLASSSSPRPVAPRFTSTSLAPSTLFSPHPLSLFLRFAPFPREFWFGRS